MSAHLPNENGKRVEIIPYPSSQIKVEKSGSKKTASIFCAPRRRSNVILDKNSRKEHNENFELTKSSVYVSSDAASVSSMSQPTENELSDSVSVVSDASDLSVISSIKQMSVLSVDDVHFTHSRRQIIPQVHGQEAQSIHGFSIRREKLGKPAVKKIPKTFLNSVVDSRPSHKEITQLREENFGLKRENVNLKGQVESLQQHQRSLLSHQASPHAHELLAKHQQKSSEDQGYRQQLRNAQDEIFRLQSEEAKRNHELTNMKVDLAECKERIEKLLKEKSSLSVRNLELTGENDRLRLGAQQHEVEENHSLDSLKADLGRLEKAKIWYEKQLKSSQDNRKALERSLTETKATLMSRNEENARLVAQIDDLKYEVNQAKSSLEKEKENFSAKLNKIEAEMHEQETQIDHIQSEKDQIIAELTKKLNNNELSNDHVASMVQNIKKLETELDDLSKKVEQKDEVGKTLQEGNKEKDKVIQTLKNELKTQRSEFDKNIESLQEEKELLNMDVKKCKEFLLKSEEKCKELQNHLQLNQDLTSSLQADQKQIKDQLEKLRDSEKAKCEKIKTLESDVSESYEALEDSRALNLSLQTQLACRNSHIQEQEVKLSTLEKELAESKDLERDLTYKLKESREAVSKLEREITLLREEISQSESTAPELEEIRKENIALRQKVQHLEQFENEATELRQTTEELEETKSSLTEKLLESEKVYDEEVENLRSLVIERDKVIESMRKEFEDLITDLNGTKNMLETVTSDRDRAKSEQSRRIEDLEDTVEEYERTKKLLLERENGLFEAQEKLKALQEDNENLVEQLKNAVIRADTLEAENQRFVNLLEDAKEASDEMKEIHSQRIGRLENFIAEYERELEEINTTKGQLQTQIMTLEAANGKLMSESLVNEALRQQLKQMQEDLKSDTDLREELVKSVESAKASLGQEIASLEVKLKSERDENVKCKEQIFQVESEKLGLQKKFNELQLQLEDCSHELEILRKKTFTTSEMDKNRLSPCDEVSASVYKEIRELRQFLEDKDRSIASLEDHIETLKFNVVQKDSEVEEAKRIFQINCEKYENSLERVRASEQALRQELTQQTRTLNLVIDERNNYRVQVQQMNMALRNSLEHIKRLRSQASCPTSPEPFMDESILHDLNQRAQSTPTANLTSLQNCLASLKAEMAILQSRLAPSSQRGTPHHSLERIPTSFEDLSPDLKEDTD